VLKGFCSVLIVSIALGVVSFGPINAAAGQIFVSGNWRVDCEFDRMTDKTRCMVKLQVYQASPKGGFAMVVGPGTASPYVSLIGIPSILFVTARVDRNPALSCKGPEFCNFSPADSAAITRELASASEVLLQVATAPTIYDFTQDARGYRECLAKVREWGFSADVEQLPHRR
jgi:hypothetical protein